MLNKLIVILNYKGALLVHEPCNLPYGKKADVAFTSPTEL